MSPSAKANKNNIYVFKMCFTIAVRAFVFCRISLSSTSRHTSCFAMLAKRPMKGDASIVDRGMCETRNIYSSFGSLSSIHEYTSSVSSNSLRISGS